MRKCDLKKNETESQLCQATDIVQFSYIYVKHHELEDLK